MTNTLVVTRQQLQPVLDALEKARTEDLLTGMDYETSGLFFVDQDPAYIVGQSWSIDGENAWYIPLAHDEVGGIDPNYPDEDEYWTLVRPFLEQLKIVAHNAIFEATATAALKRYGSHTTGTKHTIDFHPHACSQIDVYLTGLMEKTLGLKDAIEFLFKKKRKNLADFFGGKKSDIAFNRLDPRNPEVLDYACEDAKDTLTVHNKIYPILQKDKQLAFLYKVDTALIESQRIMHDNAWPVDVDFMKREVDRLRQEAEKIRLQVMTMVSDSVGFPIPPLNPGSPAQVGKILFDPEMLGIVPANDSISWTKGGKTGNKKPSTSEDALARLKADYPIVQMILDWRSLTKLASTYLEGYQKWVNADTRIRPHYLWHVVPTGRSASGDPNLQNVPGEDIFTVPSYQSKDGMKIYQERSIVTNIRDSFVAPRGWYFLIADYSQIELRILVGMAKDEKSIQAFRDGIDFHQATAAAMFKKELTQVTKQDRARGKTQNFAVVYGQSPGAMAVKNAISFAEAQHFYKAYRENMPAIMDYRDRAIEEFRAKGYVRTVFGRKRYQPNWKSAIPAELAEADRGAFNTIIQGGAADLLRIAIVRALRSSKMRKWTEELVPNLPADHPHPQKLQLIGETHDDITWLVHQSVPLSELLKEIRDIMCIPMPGFPPIVIEPKVGISWGQMVDIDLDGRTKEGKLWDYDEALDSWVHVGEEDRRALKAKASNGSMNGSVHGPQKIVLTLKIVEPQAFPLFKQVLLTNAGRNIVVLRTDDGDELECSQWPTSLTADDTRIFEEIFAGAVKVEKIEENGHVEEEMTEADARVLLDGLDLEVIERNPS